MISIDAGIFLGMHSKDDSVRIYCKNLVVNFLFKGIAISCEEVGKCDNMIWSIAPGTQYEYFLFMDALMTEGKFKRYTYNTILIEKAFQNKQPLAVELANYLSIEHFTIKKITEDLIQSVSETNFASESLEQLYINSLNTKFEFQQLQNLLD